MWWVISQHWLPGLSAQLSTYGEGRWQAQAKPMPAPTDVPPSLAWNAPGNFC